MAELKDFADSVALVVSSCDRLFDTWRPFAFFFRKFWPDCPFPAYFVVNRLQVRSDRFQIINCGKDQGYGSRMLLALQLVTRPYIFYTQDDYFLTAPVDERRLADDLAYALECDAASFCFHERDPSERGFSPINDRFGIVPRDSKFRALTQTAFWKREALISILRPGESPWGMEAHGSERTREMLILSYRTAENSPIPYLKSAIVRALWLPEAIALCRQYGFAIRPRFRPTSTPSLAGRRFRRALGRVTYPLAWLKQRLSKPINLDR